MGRLSWLGLGGQKHENGSWKRAPETPPSRVAGAADGVVKTILGIHSLLLKETDLHPKDTVNKLLSELVRVCTRIYDFNVTREVLSNRNLRDILPSIRSICAQAECCLEKHWAEKIAAGTDADDVYHLLKSFPYYANYEQLARLELSAICCVDVFPQRVAFMGSGPLPLTSLCLLAAIKAGQNGLCTELCSSPDVSQATVLNIDHDSAAIAISKKLSEKLGKRGAGAAFLCTEAGSEAVNLTAFNVVYFAALVGTSQTEKEELLIKVVSRMRAGALVVIRSSWGLRTCLYSEFDVASEALLQRLDVALVLHPYGEVVNSIVIARVKAHPRCP